MQRVQGVSAPCERVSGKRFRVSVSDLCRKTPLRDCAIIAAHVPPPRRRLRVRLCTDFTGERRTLVGRRPPDPLHEPFREHSLSWRRQWHSVPAGARQLELQAAASVDLRPRLVAHGHVALRRRARAVASRCRRLPRRYWPVVLPAGALRRVAVRPLSHCDRWKPAHSVHLPSERCDVPQAWSRKGRARLPDCPRGLRSAEVGRGLTPVLRGRLRPGP